MTGLEVLVVIGLLVGGGATTLALNAMMGERKKRRFVDCVAAQLTGHVDHYESGDINQPLAFTVDDIKVQAAVRGDVEVWQLEVARFAGCEGVGVEFAVVHREWRAPDAELCARSLIGDVTPRLSLFAGVTSEQRGSSFLARARAQLAGVLGRGARRCVVEDGRAFLEVTRSGFDVAELVEALLRLDALVAVASGRDALLRLPAGKRESAVAGPLAGVPVPALTG